MIYTLRNLNLFVWF